MLDLVCIISKLNQWSIWLLLYDQLYCVYNLILRQAMYLWGHWENGLSKKKIQIWEGSFKPFCQFLDARKLCREMKWIGCTTEGWSFNELCFCTVDAQANESDSTSCRCRCNVPIFISTGKKFPADTHTHTDRTHAKCQVSQSLVVDSLPCSSKSSDGPHKSPLSRTSSACLGHSLSAQKVEEAGVPAAVGRCRLGRMHLQLNK